MNCFYSKSFITDTKLNTKTVITYINGFVYQKILPSSTNASTVPDTLQYVLHEEGRIRWSYNGANPSGHFVYDYFLKDHLGNIRSVITDEQDTSFYPPASLETATIANEKNYYTGLDNGVVARSSISGYPSNDHYTNPNDEVQQLRGDGVKIGAGILLKVMAGDTINVHASSWYNDGSTPGTPVTPLGNIVSSILSSLPAISGGKFADGSVANSMITPSINSFLNERNATENTSHPRSWLNIIVLDEQLKPVITGDGNNSYFEQVGSSGGSSVQQYNPQRPITKNGYVYIYVSNETPNIYTYWDNLQITHIHGHLLQEEGYYPFGLEMKAISSQAPLKPVSRYKYDAGNELEDNFDVDYYETPYRNYDPQIGRFTSVDPLAEWYYHGSTYQYATNDPVYFNDPSGLAFAVPKKPVNPLGGMSLWALIGFNTGYYAPLGLAGEIGINGFGTGDWNYGGRGYGGGPHGGGSGGGSPLDLPNLVSNPDFQPLSTQDLRDRIKRFSPTLPDWQVNVSAGLLFEDLYQDFSGFSKNTTSSWEIVSRPPYLRNVIPDFKFPTTLTTKDDEYVFPQGGIIEAKAIGSSVSLSTSRSQIEAEIDAAHYAQDVVGLSIAGAKHAAAFTLVLPFYSSIDPSVVEYATGRGVNMYASYAFINQVTGKIVFSNPSRLNNLGTTGEYPYGPVGSIIGVNPNLAKAVNRWRIEHERDGDNE